MAARFKIIILERLSPSQVSVRFAMWADVPAARQAFYADANKKSAWTGANASDLTALQNGSVLERVETLTMDSAATVPNIKASLQSRYTIFQDEVTNTDKAYQFYGTTWDGTTWVAAGA